MAKTVVADPDTHDFLVPDTNVGIRKNKWRRRWTAHDKYAVARVMQRPGYSPMIFTSTRFALRPSNSP